MILNKHRRDLKNTSVFILMERFSMRVVGVSIAIHLRKRMVRFNICVRLKQYVRLTEIVR